MAVVRSAVIVMSWDTGWSRDHALVVVCVLVVVVVIVLDTRVQVGRSVMTFIERGRSGRKRRRPEPCAWPGEFTTFLLWRRRC